MGHQDLYYLEIDIRSPKKKNVRVKSMCERTDDQKSHMAKLTSDQTVMEVSRLLCSLNIAQTIKTSLVL